MSVLGALCARCLEQHSGPMGLAGSEQVHVQWSNWGRSYRIPCCRYKLNLYYYNFNCHCPTGKLPPGLHQLVHFCQHRVTGTKHICIMSHPAAYYNKGVDLLPEDSQAD